MPRSLAASIQELEKAASEVGITVRYERLRGIRPTVGGLCTIKGRLHVIIERRARDHEKYEVLLDALARVDTDGVFLSPELRKLIDERRNLLKSKENQGVGNEI